MIEVVALAGAINSISGAITSSIQAGRNLSQIAPQIAKLGALDSQVQAAEAGKHKGILSKLTSTEAEALAITQAKMAHKQAMEKLRETMLLFGETGTWEAFNKNLADARARKKRQLEELSKIRKTKELIAALIIGALVFGGGSYAAVYFFVQTVG